MMVCFWPTRTSRRRAGPNTPRDYFSEQLGWGLCILRTVFGRPADSMNASAPCWTTDVAGRECVKVFSMLLVFAWKIHNVPDCTLITATGVLRDSTS